MDFTPLEQDEEFRGYSWKDQIEAKSAYADSILTQKEPDYQFLSDVDKNYILGELTKGTPVFKDPNMSQKVKGIEAQLASQNPDDFKAAKDFITYSYQQEKFRDMSMIGSLMGAITDPLQMTLDKFIFDKEDDFLSVEEGHRHPENSKLREWVEYTIKNDDRFKKDLMWINVLNTVHAGLEIIATYGAFAGSTFNPKGLAKPVVDYISKGVKASNSEIVRGLLTATKPVAHAGVTSLMAGARELMIENLNKGSQENYSVQETLLGVSDKLPSYVALDILANVVLDVALPTGWAAKKILTGGFAGKASFKEAGEAALEHVLTGKALSQTLIDRVPEAAKHVEDVRIKFAALKNLDKAKPKDLAWAIGESLGYRAKEVEQGIEFTQIGSNKVAFKGEIDKAFKFLKAKVNEVSGVTLEDKALVGAKGESFVVRNVIERQLSPDHAGSAPVLTNLLAPVGGKYNKEKLKGFVRTFLKSQDAESKIIKSVNIKSYDDVVNLKRDLIIEIDGKKIFTLPESISTPEMESEIASKLTKELQIFSRGSKDIAGTFVDGYKEQVKAQRLYSPEWIEQALKGLDEYGEGARIKIIQNGQVEVLGKNGKEVFNSAEQLVDTLNRKTLSLEELNNYLDRNYKLSLKIDNGKVLLMNESKKVLVDTYESIDDFFENSTIKPKLSSQLAPQIYVLDDGAVKIKYIQKASVGQYHHILSDMDKYLSKVKPWKEIDLSVGGKKRVIQFSDNPAIKTAEIFYPEINHTESFKSIAEARKSLTKNFETFDELHKVAGGKGFYLNTVGSKYYLIDSAGKTVVYENAESVKNFLKTIPTVPEYAPELSPLSPDLVEGIVGHFNLDPVKYVNPKFLKNGEMTTDGLKNAFTSNSFSIAFTTMEGYLRKAVARGENIEVQKLFYEIRDTRNIIHVEDIAAADYIHNLFKVNGKKISTKTKEIMTQYLEETDTVKKEALGVKLSPDEKAVVERVRQFYGTERGRGAYLKYAQEFVDFKSKYAPVIREWALKEDKKNMIKEGLSPNELLKDVFEDKDVAKKIGAFFRHSRVQDIIDVARDMDLESAMLKYAKVGNRALYLAPIWDKAATLMKNGKNISDATKMRFLMYQGEVMGTFKLPYEKISSLSFEKFYDDISKGNVKTLLNPKEVKAKTQKVQSWMYMNLMGFKPMLAMRNGFQPYSTTASYLGTEYVMRAEKALINDLDGVYYNQLKSEGLIRGEIPLFEEDVFSQKVMNKYYQLGLKWFGNSEDYVRAVTAKTSELRFNDAWEEYVKSNGKMAQEEFLKKSGMKWLEASRQIQAMEMLNKGNVKGAKALFASDMVDKGAFRYQSGETIPFFTNHGAVGRLFGKFGTYSVQYLAQINSVLSKASLEEKIAFATRLVGNTVLINEALGEVGINGSSLLWYSPIGFAGGPSFDLLYTGLQGTQAGFEGKKARGKFWSEATGMAIPGWFRNMLQGVNYAVEGDYYKGFLKMVGAGLDDDFFGD